MIELFNQIASLLGRLYYLPRSFSDQRERAEVERFLPDYIQQAEDILASGLQKGGLAPEVARDSAFRYGAGILEGLARADALPASTAA